MGQVATAVQTRSLVDVRVLQMHTKVKYYSFLSFKLSQTRELRNKHFALRRKINENFMSCHSLYFDY